MPHSKPFAALWHDCELEEDVWVQDAPRWRSAAHTLLSTALAAEPDCWRTEGKGAEGSNEQFAVERVPIRASVLQAAVALSGPYQIFPGRFPRKGFPTPNSQKKIFSQISEIVLCGAESFGTLFSPVWSPGDRVRRHQHTSLASCRLFISCSAQQPVTDSA